MSRGFSTVSIGRATRRCHATGRALHDGERYIAALYEPVPDPVTQRPVAAQSERHDYSLEACPDGKPPQRQRLIAFWRAVCGTETKKDRPLLDDDALLDLFEQTGTDDASSPATYAPQVGTPEFHRRSLRYVVALLLLRRRLLVQDGHKGTTILVRHRGTPRPPEGPPLLVVYDPGLDEQMILDLFTQLDGSGDVGAIAPDSNPGGA